MSEMPNVPAMPIYLRLSLMRIPKFLNLCRLLLATLDIYEQVF